MKKIVTIAATTMMFMVTAAIADVNVYGRINNAIQFTDGEEEMKDVNSRFGLKASVEPSGDVDAFARYEFGVNNNDVTTRLAYVGVNTQLGSVSLGKQWSAYHNAVGSLVDQGYELGLNSLGPNRTDDTVKYSNDFGIVTVATDYRVNDMADEDEFAVALSGSFGPVNVAYAYENVAYNDMDKSVEGSTNGVVVSGNVSQFTLASGHEWTTPDMGDETTHTFVSANAALNKDFDLKVGHGWSETGTVESNQTFVGGYYQLANGVQLWSEFRVDDKDDVEEDTLLVGLSIDF